ncbi:MAG: BatD family protein [Planctomycetaceae bacterium]|nr:BatD family protein [Planctomycetaceae bacterium]
MMRRCYVFLFFIFLCILPLQAAPQMSVGVDRTTVYEGESILYWITLIDTQPIEESIMPDVSALNDFHIVQTVPRNVSMMRSTQNIQGVVTETTTSRVRFAYVLAPKRSGSLTIPKPNVSVNGQQLVPNSMEIGGQSLGDLSSGGAISITVRPPNDQDLVWLKIETDKSRLYPCQPVTVTLVVQVKGLPEKLDSGQSTNPLQVLRDPPKLTIPWANSDTVLPKGMIPQRKFDDWLRGLHVRRPQHGFAINDYASEGFGFDDDFFRSPFSFGGMLRRTPLQFAPNPSKIRRLDSSGQETTYWEFRFSRTFIPETIGRFSFGPVTLKGVFAAVDSNTTQGVSPREVYALASEVAVEVSDVPRENRPNNYIGAFGTFDWSVDLQPRQAKVGDPMTLTLCLTGQGSTTHVTPPDLSQNSEITANFKVYPPTEEVNDKSCTFTYTVRPTQEGSLVFPALSVAFFDVDKEEFITLSSDPMTMEITESKTTHSAPIFANRQLPVSETLERSDKGLFANMTDPSKAIQRSVDFVGWLLTMVSLVSVYVLLVFGVFVWRVCHSNPKLRRRRGAGKRAKQRFVEVLATRQKSDNPTALFGNNLQNVFFGYVADLTDGVEQGMTTKDACIKLLELGVTEQTVSEVRGILETLDATRYGGFDLKTLDELAEETNSLLKRIPKELTLSE